ncbi:hypothetical protein EC957_009508 [Mortierella hygrophila]|uniref:Uncharacterized protein n=1 Tax=Mortierella hygrophila TaxID=979708 RepID=A0A9P6EX32_9FUNG|nr:hypothetical protein EC957_009508 [Mortierella hygrophila]
MATLRLLPGFQTVRVGRHSLLSRSPLVSVSGVQARPLLTRSPPPINKSITQRSYSTSLPPGSSTVATTTTTTTNTTATSEIPKKLSKFRQYAEQFKNKPASHLISFGILHEITAIVPLPIVYFALVETGIKIPFPEQAIEEGNRFVGRVAKYYGWDLEGADGARTMLNMATSYAVVKALMPLRLALCVWMTPWTATRIISPAMNFWRRFKK